MKNEVVKVKFNGNEIVVFLEEEDVWVSVWSVCDGIGIDKTGQKRRLLTYDMVTWKTYEDSNGILKDVFLINLNALNDWLYSINRWRIYPLSRKKLDIYCSGLFDEIKKNIDFINTNDDENIYEIIDIEFLDNKIQFIIDEYENIWISVEQICEHLNIDLDWYMQALVDLADLADLGYNVCTFKVFDSDGEKYDVFMIHINSVKAWLNAIRFNDIKFEFRGILTRYREEIVDFVMNAIVDFDTISVFGNETINNNMVSDENKTIENVIEKEDTQNIELGRRIDDNKYEAIEIYFYGGIIELVEDENNNIWINVKKICDMFGISYSEQHIKLESIDWKNWVVWKIVNKQFMINLDCFKDWLLKIEPNIVSLKSRHILVKYQKEIDSDIIRKVFREEIEGGNKNNKVDKADFYVSKTKKIKKLKKDIDDNYKCYVVDVGSNNKKVEVVRDGNGGIWIYTKRICKILGIDYRNHMMKLASKDWANWKIIFAVHNNGKKHKWFMLHIDCFDKWINSIKKNILKTKDNMSWGDFVEIKKYSYMIKKGVDRAIREENTTVVEEHFEGEELVGRTVYETDEEIDKSKDVVKCDTLEEDEEQRDGGVKRPLIEKEDEEYKDVVKCDTLEEDKEEKMKDEKMSKDIMNDIVKMFEYEGEPLTALTYKGQPAVIAKEFGKFLGYAKDGSKLVSLINDEWKKSFESGKHFVVLKDKELKQFKELMKVNPSYGFSRAPHIMLLFRKGMYKTAFKSGKERAEPLIDFVVDEVFPQLEKYGSYDPNRIADSGLVKKGVWIPEMSSEALEVLLRERKGRELAEKDRDGAIVLVREQKEKIAEMKEDIKEFRAREGGITIEEFARVVWIGGVKYNRDQMYALLRELGFLIECGVGYNKPRKKYVDDKKWFDTQIRIGSDGYIRRNGIALIFPEGEDGVIKEMRRHPEFFGKVIKHRDRKYIGGEQTSFDWVDNKNKTVK
jgi:prophage antirepressor-like protein